MYVGQHTVSFDVGVVSVHCPVPLSNPRQLLELTWAQVVNNEGNPRG